MPSVKNICEKVTIWDGLVITTWLQQSEIKQNVTTSLHVAHLNLTHFSDQAD